MWDETEIAGLEGAGVDSEGDGGCGDECGEGGVEGGVVSEGVAAPFKTSSMRASTSSNCLVNSECDSL